MIDLSNYNLHEAFELGLAIGAFLGACASALIVLVAAAIGAALAKPRQPVLYDPWQPDPPYQRYSDEMAQADMQNVARIAARLPANRGRH